MLHKHIDKATAWELTKNLGNVDCSTLLWLLLPLVHGFDASTLGGSTRSWHCKREARH